jgi:hypothetical protein
VTEGLNPSQIIQQMVVQRLVWPNEYILAELKAMPVLPDADDVLWEHEKTWEQLDLYTALARVSGMKRLKEAIPLLLERACYGDPGERMRVLYPQLESAGNGDWNFLGNACCKAAKSHNSGARLWAIAQLADNRYRHLMHTVVEALDDSAQLVRVQACWSLLLMCSGDLDYKANAIASIHQYMSTRENPKEIQEAEFALKVIDEQERSE